MTELDLAHKRVVVTGGAGFLGQAVVEALEARGVSDIIVPRSQTYDLRDRRAIERLPPALAPPDRSARHLDGRPYTSRHTISVSRINLGRDGRGAGKQRGGRPCSACTAGSTPCGREIAEISRDLAEIEISSRAARRARHLLAIVVAGAAEQLELVLHVARAVAPVGLRPRRALVAFVRLRDTVRPEQLERLVAISSVVVSRAAVQLG